MRRRGLTLLEVVFAVMLVLLAASFVMSLLAAGGKPVVRAHSTTTASMLAQSKMDVLMGVPYESLADDSGKFAKPHELYRYEVRTSDYDTVVKQVSVTVITPQGARLEVTGLRGPEPEELGLRKYQEYGCQSCHSISGYAWATGTAGPTHNGIAEVAGTRVKGQSADDYLRDSIREPNVYVVDGYGPNMLGYPLTAMPEDDLEAIVAFMKTLK